MRKSKTAVIDLTLEEGEIPQKVLKGQDDFIEVVDLPLILQQIHDKIQDIRSQTLKRKYMEAHFPKRKSRFGGYDENFLRICAESVHEKVVPDEPQKLAEDASAKNPSDEKDKVHIPTIQVNSRDASISKIAAEEDQSSSKKEERKVEHHEEPVSTFSLNDDPYIIPELEDSGQFITLNDISASESFLSKKSLSLSDSQHLDPSRTPVSQYSTVTTSKRLHSRFGGFDHDYLERQSVKQPEGSFTPVSLWSSAWSHRSSPVYSFDSDEDVDDSNQFPVIHLQHPNDSDDDDNRSFHASRTPQASSIGQRSPAFSITEFNLDDNRSVISQSYAIDIDTNNQGLYPNKRPRKKSNNMVHFVDADTCSRLVQDYQPPLGSRYCKEIDKIMVMLREVLDKFITGEKDNYNPENQIASIEDSVSYRINLTSSTKTKLQQNFLKWLRFNRNKALTELDPIYIRVQGFDKPSTGNHTFASECHFKPASTNVKSEDSRGASPTIMKQLSNYELVLMTEKPPNGKLTLHSMCRSPVYLGIVDSEHWTPYNIFSTGWKYNIRTMMFENDIYKVLRHYRKKDKQMKMTCIPVMSCLQFLSALQIVSEVPKLSLLPNMVIGRNSVRYEDLKCIMQALIDAVHPGYGRLPKKMETQKLLRKLIDLPIDAETLKQADVDHIMSELRDIDSLKLSMEISHLCQELIQKWKQVLKNSNPNSSKLQYSIPSEFFDYIRYLSGNDDHIYKALMEISHHEANIDTPSVLSYYGTKWKSVEQFLKNIISVLVGIRKDIKFRKLQNQNLILLCVQDQHALKVILESLKSLQVLKDSSNQQGVIPSTKLKVLQLNGEWDHKVHKTSYLCEHQKKVLDLHRKCQYTKEITKEVKVALMNRDNEDFWLSREIRSNCIVEYQTAKWKTVDIRNKARLDVLACTQVVLATYSDLCDPSFLNFARDNPKVIQFPTVVSVITDYSMLEANNLIPLQFGCKKFIVLERVPRISKSNPVKLHCPMIKRWKNANDEVVCIDTASTLNSESTQQSPTNVQEPESSKEIDKPVDSDNDQSILERLSSKPRLNSHSNNITSTEKMEVLTSTGVNETSKRVSQSSHSHYEDKMGDSKDSDHASRKRQRVVPIKYRDNNIMDTTFIAELNHEV